MSTADSIKIDWYVSKLVLAHGSNGSIRIGMIQYNFDTNHIGSTSNPNSIGLQVDLIQMFLDFLQKNNRIDTVRIDPLDP
jgi:hypothetical protein